MERSPASFTRSARLTRPVEYRRVFAEAGRSTSRALTVLTAPNGLSYPRLGLAISKKAASRAVVRNRIKRIVRESFRHRQGELGGWDIVVMAKASAATATRQALRAELEEHWNRLKRRPCVPSSR
ncbi:MAG: ribonuclease P protein component [Gammaproteobacteria bacterium]|nr:ribonuclease P protein component [Gammaproteobacteria bacterium]